MFENLYDKPVVGPFAAFCGGSTDNDGSSEDCLEIAPLKGGGYAVRDAKPEGADRELRFTKSELIAFAEQVGHHLASQTA